jgi:hypothetical protein
MKYQKIPKGIVLSVPLRFTDSHYPFGMFKLLFKTKIEKFVSYFMAITSYISMMTMMMISALCSNHSRVKPKIITLEFAASQLRTHH